MEIVIASNLTMENSNPDNTIVVENELQYEDVNEG